MSSLLFQAEIRINGVNPYILVTKDQAATLNPTWRKPMPVLVQVNGQPAEPWPINMMPMGTGDFYLYLHGDIRKASGTKVGDIVTVAVDFDTAYTAGPEPQPGWFTDALADNNAAAANWERLPPSRQKEVVRTLNRLQSPEAQARNLEQLMYILAGNEGRYIGRIWRNGS